MVNLGRCNGGCNTFDDPSDRICVSNKLEDVNLSVFIMITGISESKTLTKHISCKCQCKFDSRKYNSKQKWNSDKYWCECKVLRKHHVCEKGYIWNHSNYISENGKYLESIIVIQ